MARKLPRPKRQGVETAKCAPFWLKGASVIFVFAAFLLWRGCTASPPANSFAPHPAVAAFDGQRAFDLLTQQVNFGPRIPDTEPSRQTQRWAI